MLADVINSLEKKSIKSFQTEKFCILHNLGPQELQIEVSGFGKLEFPLSQNDIDKLIELASPAKYGFREKTLLDKTVRDANEISATKISVTFPTTNFSSMLEHFVKEFNFSQSVQLEAHLHNLLIYGPGQFFKPHQDAEKLENMIATLIIVMPTPHIGGKLVVAHCEDKKKFESQNLSADGFKCCAFYADCKHELKPITEGYRIALTWNLTLKNNDKNVKLNSQLKNPKLTEALKNYFNVDRLDEEEPTILAYLFKHQYSENGLKWGALKGNDAVHANTFLNSAKELGLKAHLALAEIHQNWSTDYEGGELVDLIDESRTFSDWFDESGKKLSYSPLYLSEDEMCSLIPLEDLDPYETEEEGYMGNYGNTKDFWYRLGALVLWKKSDQLVMDFKLNYHEALKKLRLLTQTTGNETEVENVIERAKKYFKRNTDNLSKIEEFCILVDLACYVRNSQKAQTLLEDFSLADLAPQHLEFISKLNRIYGTAWCMNLLKKWGGVFEENNNNRIRRSAKLNYDSNVIKKSIEWKCNIEIAQFLLHCQWERMLSENKTKLNRNEYSPYSSCASENNAKRINHTIEIFEGCLALQNKSMYQEIIDHILCAPKLYPDIELTNLIIYFDGRIEDDFLSGSSFEKLRNHTLKGLKQEIEQGLRSQNDWSIITSLGCSCKYCTIATEYLQSSQEIVRVWPIAMDIREHIQQVFRKLELPINLSVEKKGSPHKLVMEKSTRLYEHAKSRFEKVKECYAAISR
ncbi:MAG: 2OG-Fe(II) oxygenase [Bdellovibrionota bacterium]